MTTTSPSGWRPGCGEPPVTRPCQVVTVTSGKGGVGRTSIVANLGLELARAGATVLLVDGDGEQADLGLLFDVRGGDDPVDGVYEIAPRLRLATAATRADVLSGPADDALLRLPGADFVLIDTGGGLSAGVLSLVALAGRVLAVTTHEPTAAAASLAMLRAARQRGARRLGIVVNLAASHSAARETHARLAQLAERDLGFSPPLAAVIPRDPAVGDAIVRQRPMSAIYPYAQATRAVAALARTLIDPEGNHHERTHVSLALRDRW